MLNKATKMKKEFDLWNKRKKEINREVPNFYHEREIRWCSLGINIGFEQDGTNKTYRRPVLIIKGFSRQVCLIVPLTTSAKKNPYHISGKSIVEHRGDILHGHKVLGNQDIY